MPYVEVVKAAVIPAILYFTGVFVVVHFEAKKCGLKGLSREELPKIGRVLKERFYLVLPLVGIIYFLVEGSTPMRTALSGLVLRPRRHAYIFVFSPSLLMINATFPAIVQITITSITGMVGVGAAVEGWYWTRMTWWERIIALAAGLMLIDPGTVTTSWVWF